MYELEIIYFPKIHSHFNYIHKLFSAAAAAAVAAAAVA